MPLFGFIMLLVVAAGASDAFLSSNSTNSILLWSINLINQFTELWKCSDWSVSFHLFLSGTWLFVFTLGLSSPW